MKTENNRNCELIDISFIIINYNTGTLLKNCIASIYNCCKNISFEILVVDNASEDESILMVKKNFSMVTIVENNKNVGFSKANNQAIQQSKGSYLFLLNPDTKIIAANMNNLIEFMDKNSGIGAVGAALLNQDGTPQPSCRQLPSLKSIFWKTLLLDSKNFQQTTFDFPQEIEQPMGAAIVVRRMALDKIGLFDEQFFLYYEEVDLCKRLKDAGWKIYFYPEIKIIHYGCISSFQFFSKNIVENYRSLYKYFHKHYHHCCLPVLKLLTSAGIAIKIMMLAVAVIIHSGNKNKKAYTMRFKGYSALFIKNIFL
ncbi:MAG: glycosyltransferase family 2 protein [Candidatus Omnitrophota bacterium]